MATVGCGRDAAPEERTTEEDVDIPPRAPTESKPRVEVETPADSEPDDAPDPISRPPVVVPPVDRTVANGTSPRGGSCSMNFDCVPGLTCFTTIGQSTAGFESIAGGYCSTLCVGDDDCAAVGAASFYYKGIYGLPTGFCTAPCGSSAPEADKCGGRTDLVCYGSPDEVGNCDPTCGSDAQCNGAFCGFGTGQCRSTPLDPTGTRVGEACPAGEPVKCEGFCVTETDQDGICTGPCRLGSPCGNDPSALCVPSDPALRRGDFACASTPSSTATSSPKGSRSLCPRAPPASPSPTWRPSRRDSPPGTPRSSRLCGWWSARTTSVRPTLAFSAWISSRASSRASGQLEKYPSDRRASTGLDLHRVRHSLRSQA